MTAFEIDAIYVEKPLANYIFVVREPESGVVAVIDPGFADPAIEALDARGLKPELILLTHHHGDHIAGAPALKARYGARIIAPGADRHRIDDADEWVREGDVVYIGRARGVVFAIPGHTLGHVAYYFEDRKTLFCGDTLFSLGCGRLFEGTPEMMWRSLSKIRALPADTAIWCAHEYTLANGAFAETIEPGNAALAARMKAVKAAREAGRPTIPNSLENERRTNPFLRPDSPEIRKTLGMEAASDVAVFAEIRRRKDNF